jgi:hypothetical protein
VAYRVGSHASARRDWVGGCSRRSSISIRGLGPKFYNPYPGIPIPRHRDKLLNCEKALAFLPLGSRDASVNIAVMIPFSLKVLCDQPSTGGCCFLFLARLENSKLSVFISDLVDLKGVNGVTSGPALHGGNEVCTG